MQDVLPNPLYAQCVTRAARLLGGLDSLARELYLAPRVLERWVDGRSKPPTAVFLRIVDILLGDDVPTTCAKRRTNGKASPST